MDSTLEFRRFWPGDGPVCHTMRRTALLQDHFQELSAEDRQAGAEAYNPEVFEHLLLDLETYVALREDTVLGFCSLRALARGEAEVLFLYLDPAIRHQGVGAALLQFSQQAVVAAFPEVERFAVLAGIAPQNQAFWQRQGYQAVGRSFCRFPGGQVPTMRMVKAVGEGDRATLAAQGYGRLVPAEEQLIP